MTNADVIRAMSDDELDDFLASFELRDIHYGITFCDLCMKDKEVGGQGNVLDLDCDDCRKHWLQSEATETNGLKYWEKQENRTMSEWIPVSERLPEQQEKSYWICTDHGYQCECRWTNVNHIWTWLTTDWHWHFADVPQYEKVVAWMPLPEPYKESEE